MEMNSNEQALWNKLEDLRLQKKWIELQLWPGTMFKTIVAGHHNVCRINEGRLGKFNNISEAFYDRMVEIYSSRNN